MNCALCGKPLSRMELGKYKVTLRDGSEHPVCKDCNKQNVQKGIRKDVKEILVDQGKLKKLKEQSLQGTEQTPPKPRKTEVGPPEAVIGAQIEEIEAEMVLIRAQMAEVTEMMKTLGYRIKAIKEAVKSGQ